MVTVCTAQPCYCTKSAHAFKLFLAVNSALPHLMCRSCTAVPRYLKVICAEFFGVFLIDFAHNLIKSRCNRSPCRNRNSVAVTACIVNRTQAAVCHFGYGFLEYGIIITRTACNFRDSFIKSFLVVIGGRSKA